MGNVLEQGGYSEIEVMRMLMGNRTIDFSFDVMDNRERILCRVSATGSVSFDSTRAIMGTASLSIQEENLNKLAEYYSDMRIRPCFKLLTPTGWLAYPLGIFIMTSPKRSLRDNTVYWDVDCFDKGIILREDRLQDRLYIPAGSNYISQVKNILLTAGIDKYIIENSGLTARYDLEFEIGTSKLDVINNLLYAINYYPIHFDNNGFAESSRYIEPMQRETQFSYMTDENSLVLPDASQFNDFFNVPNVVIRYLDHPDGEPLRSVFVNDNPNSPVSTVRRGRRIVDVESVDDIADQGTLDEYTKRYAIEKSQVFDSVYLNTALMPMHGFKNCIFLRCDDLKIETKYMEYAWGMDLKAGGKMTHQLKRVVYL